MKRRNFILLLGGASSGAMSVGTGAFSSMEAERGVSAEVVSDDEAFVGYQSSDRALPGDDDGSTVDLVTVKNRFAHKVKIVNANIDDGSKYFGDPNVPNNAFEPGKSATVTAEPNIPTGGEVDVTVTVTVEGAGVSAKVFGNTETREFVVTQEEGTSSVVRYKGKKTVNVGNKRQYDDPMEIDVYRRIPNGESAEDPSIEVDKSVGIELGKNEGFDERVVAVKIDGVIYQHPGWNESACEFGSPMSGDGVVVDELPSCSTVSEHLVDSPDS